MIKLNNKNITYVALADTNNSLKAPKEIWYADSNNSVKLVYRRKDALIEGEDYEKYHWLDGDGSAYIDTLINPSFGDELNATFTLSSKPTVINIYILAASDNVNIVGFLTGGDFPVSGNPQLLIKNNPVATGSRYIEWNWRSLGTTIKEYYMYMKINDTQIPDTTVKSDGVICNYNNIVGDNRISEVPTTTYKIGKGYSAQTGLDTVKLKNITISSKINLIPCKLLKPLPQWLDTNGIRRQVGECGMIDLVSGKFYGNVNSVGTFTVENYYERKEWLVGDGSAYIDTNITEVNQNIITLNAIIDVSIYNQALFGAEDITVSSNKRVFVRYSVNKLIIYDSNPSRQVVTDTIVNLVFSDDGNVYLNGNEVTTYSSPLSLTDSILLFAAFLRNSQGTSIQNSTNMKVSHFSISDRINLIPCTLTMDLPASMDANNIARTKGTSGMWDLVSDRFYGNVASSGTFKAVNLAEGVDYEVHQWLVGDGSAYIDTLHSASEDLDWATKVADLTDGKALFWDRNGDGYAANMNVMIARTNDYRIGVRIANNSSEILLNPFPSSFTVQTNGASITIDGQSYSIIKNAGFNRNIKLFQSLPFADTNGVKCAYFHFIDANGTIIQNIIPCKLLKSIPSTYDANGIARQAGECGMYDTVNDLFYGNVASSGSFSVSDDS